jgi:hypothetical protein
MLYALLDSSAVIDVPHLQAALALWAYCAESARLIFGADDEVEDPLQARILKLIRTALAGLTRTEIHRALSGHVPAATLVAALAGLRDRGLIVPTVEETGGRRAERWRVRQPCEVSETSAGTSPPGPAGEDNALSALSSHPPADGGTEVLEL